MMKQVFERKKLTKHYLHLLIEEDIKHQFDKLKIDREDTSTSFLAYLLDCYKKYFNINDKPETSLIN